MSVCLSVCVCVRVCVSPYNPVSHPSKWLKCAKNIVTNNVFCRNGKCVLCTFLGSGKLLNIFLQSWKIDPHKCFQSELEAYFHALKSCNRWLFNAYRCFPQLVILRHDGAKRIGALFGIKHFATKLQKRVPKMYVLGPKNVAIIYYGHKRQKFSKQNRTTINAIKKTFKRHKRHYFGQIASQSRQIRKIVFPKTCHTPKTCAHQVAERTKPLPNDVSPPPKKLKTSAFSHHLCAWLVISQAYPFHSYPFLTHESFQRTVDFGTRKLKLVQTQARLPNIVMTNNLTIDCNDVSIKGAKRIKEWIVFSWKQYAFLLSSQKNGISNLSPPSALRIKTRDETGFGQGNRTKICFFETWNVLNCFETPVDLFVSAKYSHRKFLAASGKARSGWSTSSFLVFGAYGCLSGGVLGGSGFQTTGCNRAIPGDTGHKRSTLWNLVVNISYKYNQTHSRP